MQETLCHSKNQKTSLISEPVVCTQQAALCEEFASLLRRWCELPLFLRQYDRAYGAMDLVLGAAGVYPSILYVFVMPEGAGRLTCFPQMRMRSCTCIDVCR